MKQEETMERAGFVTAQRAAELAGVTQFTVYNWIRENKIEASQVGDRWYVKRESLAQHLGPVGATALGISTKGPGDAAGAK